MNYGPLMIDLEGTTLTKEESELLKHPLVGGVLLFTRNYNHIDGLRALTSAIRKEAGHPLLIAVDHEGGRVWRFKEGFTQLPAAREYGVLFDKNEKLGLQRVKNAGFVMARELLHCGIDISLAPVLDLDLGVSTVVLDRAFHKDPKIVAQLAGAFIQGMNDAGMAATGKHFPGHGGCVMDSHHEQTIDKRSIEELKHDYYPFQQLSDALKAVMPAHVIYSAVDSVPAGYSKRWLQKVLREDIGFQGAVISDCLSMKGAAMGGDYVIRARMAIDAGCDLVILSQQKRDLLAFVLDKLERSNSNDSSQRLSRLAGNFEKSRKNKENEASLEVAAEI